jgi:hypothetical protein
MPGLTLGLRAGRTRVRQLAQSHTEVGLATDSFRNQYRDGDTAYRGAFN